MQAFGHMPKPTDSPFHGFPSSPVARVALLVGRAVSGVYAKVMNFRSIDPRAAGAGMSGVGETDRQVWSEFFDPEIIHASH